MKKVLINTYQEETVRGDQSHEAGAHQGSGLDPPVLLTSDLTSLLERKISHVFFISHLL